jgi:predicted phage baseplate assembly protein
MAWDLQDVLPAVYLTETSSPLTPQPVWKPLANLLESTDIDDVFVVEVETAGVPGTTLRFGDNVSGHMPDPGTLFNAVYRTGNGTAGNVGAESLYHVVTDNVLVANAVNWLPAQGGVDPETNDQIVRRVPQAFLTQERAITPADYAAVAMQNTQVLNASANLRWTGSWYTVFLTPEPVGGGPVSAPLLAQLSQSEEQFRLAGQDVQVNQPVYVSLEITMLVTVDPDYFQSDVQSGLLQVLGSKRLPGGRVGLFFPDNFTFGQTVYLSPVYAAAFTVPGVLAVQVTQFQQQGASVAQSTQTLASGQINLEQSQIARLDNDPNFPDHGTITFVLTGGK